MVSGTLPDMWNEPDMRTTLRALRARKSEVADELSGLEDQVTSLRAEAENLQAAIVALQRLVGEEDTPGAVSDADASDAEVPASSPSAEGDRAGPQLIQA